jgi:hypothetical protein
MATAALERPVRSSGNGFLLGMAIVMALINFASFSFFAYMGISSFGAPLYVHAHALLFMGWVVLFVTQATLATSGQVALHRTLGWLAVCWAAAMVIVGTMTTVWTIQRGQVPFFFPPAQFLLINPLSVLVFAALIAAGFAQRRDREWHPRLILSAMAVIMGPAFGRALPAPILMYNMVPAIFAVMLVFPVAGMLRDRMRLGRVHPAWIIGFCAIAGVYLTAQTAGRSAFAGALYDRVVAGTPAAKVPGLSFGRSPFSTAP